MTDIYRTPGARMNLPSPPALDLRSKSYGPGGTMRGRPPIEGFDPATQSSPQVPVGHVPTLGRINTVLARVQTTDAIYLPMPANTRIFLAIRNVDLTNNGNVWVSWGISAAAADDGGGWRFAAGESYNFMDFVPQDDLHLIASANNTLFLIWYSTATIY